MSWLSGWNKRIGLTINGDHINSTLSDFPLAIKLSSSTGITNEDVTDVFDELDYNVNDDFTGADNSFANSDKWNTVDTTGTVRIVNNALHINLPNASASKYPNINSIFKLEGDFDIQVDFNNLATGNNLDYGGCEFRFQPDDADYKIYIKATMETGAKIFRCNIKVSGTDHIGSSSRTNNFGKMRIIRSGTTVTTKSMDGNGSWVTLLSRSDFVSDKGIVYNAIYAPANNGNSIVDFDNFVVNSGIISWPQKTFPNRKKIAVTNSDGTSQLYTELHYWDQANKYAVLWTKVPTLNAGVNKHLFLYYDANQSDNTTYIGDVGDLAARNVWKSSYKAVYHMSEDPSGGSSCIKDSTTNTNDLTPYGSMTSTDSVDSGLLAKAIDFDGSNDYLLLPSSKANTMMGAIDSANAISVSLWVKQDNTNNHQFFMYGVSGDPENNMEMRISSTIYLFYEYSSGSNYSVTSPSIPNPTDLHQIYITLDSSKSKIYLDGNLIKESNAASSFWSKNSTRNFIIGAYDSTPSSTYMDGKLFEYHISNSTHSADWIKAAYEAESNNLITFSTYLGYITGYVDIEGTMASGVQLYLYERESGTFIGETTSSGNGYFKIETTSSGEHFIVALDKDDPPSYNDIIKGKIVPHTLI